ncbi:unnamed protein product [Durusdinium trenchii]|uniref:Uncharacterized protein n=1 Tax=Durusdinium trenchii TaxID=1381693 RepID=A0ABP0HIQ2_9DINO
MTLVSDESLSAGAGWNSQVSATKIQLRARGCLPAGGCANLPNIYTVLQNTFVHGLNNLIQFYVSGLRSGECGSAAKQRIKSDEFGVGSCVSSPVSLPCVCAGICRCLSRLASTFRKQRRLCHVVVRGPQSSAL